MPHREGTFRARKPQHNSSSYLDRVSSVREEETLDLELFCQTGVPEGDAHQEASCSLWLPRGPRKRLFRYILRFCWRLLKHKAKKCSVPGPLARYFCVYFMSKSKSYLGENLTTRWQQPLGYRFISVLWVSVFSRTEWLKGSLWKTDESYIIYSASRVCSHQ